MKLNAFDTAAFSMQSSWYPQVRSDSGVALESDLGWTKTDWMLWGGATSSSSTMSMFINDLHSYLANGLNDVPFSDGYYVSGWISGTYYDYKARPVVGGEWSAMAVLGCFRLHKAYIWYMEHSCKRAFGQGDRSCGGSA
jgi:hypothetical protein